MFDFGFDNWFQSHQLKCKGINHFGNRLEKLENLYFLPLTNSIEEQLHVLCEKCSQPFSSKRINLNSTYNYAISWFKQFELHYLGYLVNNNFPTKKQGNEKQIKEFEQRLRILSNCINDLNNSKIESFMLTIWNSKMIQNNIVDKKYEEQQFLDFVKQQSNKLFSLASKHFYNVFLKADVKIKSQDDCDIVQIQVSKDYVFLLESSLLDNHQFKITIHHYPSLEYLNSYQQEKMNTKDIIIKSSIHSNQLLFQRQTSLKILDIHVEIQKKEENYIKIAFKYYYKHNCFIIDCMIDDKIVVFIDQTYKIFVVDAIQKKVTFLTKKLQSLQRANQILYTYFHYYKELLIVELCNKVFTISLKNGKFYKHSQINLDQNLASTYFCKKNKIKYSVLYQLDSNNAQVKNQVQQYSVQCNKQLRRLKTKDSIKLNNVKLSLNKDSKTLILLSNEQISVYDMQKGIQNFCLPFNQKFQAENYHFQDYFLVQNQVRRVLIWKQEKLFERDIRLFFKRL